ALADAGRLEEAQQSLDRLLTLPSTDPARTAGVAHRLGRAYAAAGRPHDAAASYQAALDAAIAAHGPQAIQLLLLLRPLADALLAAGRPGGAIAVLQRLADLHDWSGGYHPGVADDLRTLADLLLAQNRPTDALIHLNTALDIDDQQDDVGHLIDDLTATIRALNLIGEHEEAERLRTEMAALTATHSDARDDPGERDCATAPGPT
ncbi:Tetratricopeptide repeat-containing protein, partial [Geodermatophilus obscurus]